MEKWRDFLDTDFNDASGNYRSRDCVTAQCDQCSAKSRVQVANLIRQVNKRGRHLCWGCSISIGKSSSTKAAYFAKLKAHFEMHQIRLDGLTLEDIKLELTSKAKYTFLCNDCNTPVRKLMGSVLKSGKARCRSCGGKAGTTLESKKSFENTMMTRYGVKNPLQDDSIKAKVKATAKERYGDGGSIQVARDAFQNKYGTDNPFKLPEFQDKARQTTLENHGVDNINKLACNRDALKLRVLSIYGEHSPLKAKLYRRNKCKNYNEFCLKVATYIESSGKAANSEEVLKEFKVSAGGSLITALHHIGRSDLIRDLNSSNGESELYFYIKSIYSGEIIRNDRIRLTPKEIDVYLPDLNLGVEYNGEIWHSERFSMVKRDHEKYLKSRTENLNLLTIYETEWQSRKSQVKQFLRNLITPKKIIYGRKTNVITDQVRLREFTQEHHLQGGSQGLYWGLECDGAVVMSIVIRAHHRGGTDHVLSRVCFGDARVIGGLEKLLKSQSHDRLITWSDNRYSPVGGLYMNSGFKFDGDIASDYRYIGNDGLFSKQSMSKSALGCPKDVKEHEWCRELGLYRIWDCGKKRWVWERG